MKHLSICKIWAGFILAFCFCVAAPSFAQRKPSKSTAYHTPKMGSPERQAIMDALRGPVEKDLKMRVKFVIYEPERYLRVAGDWAFLNADFIHADGRPLGKAYFASGTASDNVQALLRRVNGKWRVVTHVTGATDVEWEDWPKKYKAPAIIVPSAISPS